MKNWKIRENAICLSNGYLKMHQYKIAVKIKVCNKSLLRHCKCVISINMGETETIILYVYRRKSALFLKLIHPFAIKLNKVRIHFVVKENMSTMFSVLRQCLQIFKNDKIQIDKVAKPFINRHFFDKVEKWIGSHRLISTLGQNCFNDCQSLRQSYITFWQLCSKPLSFSNRDCRLIR